MPHSVILSANKICIFEELEKIMPKCIFINDDNEDVIKIYDDAINTGFTEDKKLALSKICERIDKSLLYIRPSILNKDE